MKQKPSSKIQSHQKKIHLFCREFQNHLMISVLFLTFWDMPVLLFFINDNRYSCTFQDLDTFGSRKSSKEQFWSYFVMRCREMIQNNKYLSCCISSFLFQKWCWYKTPLKQNVRQRTNTEGFPDHADNNQKCSKKFQT